MASDCSEIGFLPQRLFITYAKDYEEDQTPLVEVNQFNKFFTFQMDSPLEKGPEPASVETRFMIEHSGGEGFIFRLRAELSAAFSDQVQQGMRVTILTMSDGILSDATTIDNNEGSVMIEYDKIEEGVEYLIRYDLYDKEIVSNNDLSEESFSASNTYCKLPFITQQLLIIDKKLLKHRAALNNENEEKSAIPIQKGLSCDIGKFNNTADSEFGEDGLFCDEEEYTYQVSSRQHQDLVTLYEHPFEVRGTKGELITYWYDMMIGINFMASAGIKVLLSRNDHDFNTDNPLSCLFDRSCVEATLNQKNVLKIEVILTSGLYKLVFLEQESREMRTFLTEEAGIKNKPFSFKLMAYPVLQNEERVNCPYMYLDSNFIQNKFIDGMAGQRFTFQDKIIMNIFNLTQQFDIIPEVDSLIKIRVKESYGVNTEVVLCQGEDCLVSSQQVGSQEIMMGTVQKGLPYYVEISYAKSIIIFSEFFSCPHINFEITMIPVKEAQQIVDNSKCSSSFSYDSNSLLNTIFNTIHESNGDYIFLDHSAIFSQLVDQSQSEEKQHNYIITSNRFTAHDKMQLFVEVFYEPYLYDIELSLISTDVKNVRAHIYQKQDRIEWSLYKGSKSIFVELEQGEYELQFVQKIPPTMYDLEGQYEVQCVKFQLYVVYASFIDRQQIIPNSLNYYGLLGPEGKNFGQVVYFCEECVIENIQYKHIDFVINDETVDMNFDAIISTPENSIDIFLEGVSERDDDDKDKHSYESAFYKSIKKGTKVGSKTVIDKGKGSEKQEIISSQSLQSGTRYRVIIQVKNTDDIDQKNTFNLRIEIQERPKSINKKKQKNILPGSINDIMRYKLKTEGLKESEFIVGTRTMLQWLDELRLHPFTRKSYDVYQASLKPKDTEEEFSYSMKFEVKEEEAEVYAAVFDYSGYAGLGLTITQVDDDDDDDWEAVSVPGKYYSYIPPVSLTRGSYKLTLSSHTQFLYEDADMVKFGLDFLYEKENITDFSTQVLLDTMELCGIPILPQSLNQIEYLHPLSGNQMQTYFKAKLSDLLIGQYLEFEIKDTSLVNIYLELPSKETRAEIYITKNKGTNKIKASTDDLNQDSENFLKIKGLQHENAIQIREFLNPGTYTMRIKGLEFEDYLSTTASRCEAVLIGFQVSSIATAQNKLQEQCTESTIIGNKLSFAKPSTGNLTYAVNKNIIDTSYIKTEDQGEGPFYFYFQINYDSAIEGAIAVILYKYDRDSMEFTEDQLFSVQDSQTTIFGLIEEGTYVVAIESLSSSASKYIKEGLGKGPGKNQIQVLQDPCINLQYSYYISSSLDSDFDGLNFNFYDFLSALIFGNDPLSSSKNKLVRQNQNLKKEIQDVLNVNCKYDSLPTVFEATESGYDYHYTLPFSRKQYDVVDIVAEEQSLLKIQFESQNPKNNLNAFIYSNSQMKDALTTTKPAYDEKNMYLILAPQKKAYKMKIVYDSIDEKDQCPLYNFRVALKPISLVIDENLECQTDLGMPNPQIVMNSSHYSLDQEFQISSDFFDQYVKDSKELTYDIEIKVPDRTKSYYFDIETRFDFLTADIEMTLYGRDNERKNVLLILGDALWVNEQSDDSNFDKSTMKGTVKRIKIDNVQDMVTSENQQLSDTYILRLRFNKQMSAFIRTLRASKLMNGNACFTFDLSIKVQQDKVEETNYEAFNDPDENELVRIDWSAKMKEQKIDPRQKLTVQLQFKQSMKELYKAIKFVPFIYLIPDPISQSITEFEQRIFPQTIRLATVDKSTLILTFGHGILENGKCYKLQIDKDKVNFEYDEQELAESGKICTTNCQCNLKGMKSCNEKKGTCNCHKPYTGEDCNSCIDGYVFDQETQECQPLRKCLENGGDIDCNGHGQCYQDEMTGQARCQCEPGFEDDGLEFCARCSDPLFTYPNCLSRNWILAKSEYNCENLPLYMPPYLYKNSSVIQGRVYQNEEGQADWNGIYKIQKENARRQSTHFFKVQRNSVFRLFIDTHNSGVLVKYTILDDQMNVIYTTDSEQPYVENDVVILNLKRSSSSESADKPYRLELQYQFNNATLKKDQSCPMLEISMLVQPFNKMQNYLKCQEEELKASEQMKQFSWKFDYNSYFVNENFTLTSKMRPTDSQSLYSSETEQFYIMKYDLDVEQSGNALSIITSYSFESVSLSLTLKDKATKNVIAVEQYTSLEDIEANDNSMFTLENDMLSFIEIPNIDAGQYELEILVQKFLFLPSKKITTCLNFDLFIEYVSRYVKDSSSDYEVVSIMPQKKQKLTKYSKHMINVKFNRDIDIDTVSGEFSNLRNVCFLENKRDPKNFIKAYKVMNTVPDTLSLYFKYDTVLVPDNEKCYKMVCTTKQTSGNEQIRELGIKTEYCFEKDFEIKHVFCNPNALPKFSNNKCICTYPYTGTECQECEKGYIAKSDGKNNVCVLDETQCSNDICNNHGDCQQRFKDTTCNCYDKYTGKYCDRCKDNSLAYPDCEDHLSDIYDEKSDKEYLDRRRYNTGGYQKSTNDKAMIDVNKRQQCLLSTYPTDLDRVEFMNFLGGEFHIADYYTINHDQDNFIKFTPRKQGVIKILAQQPELEELSVNDEGFDIEIAIYDKEKDKFLETNMNHFLDFETKNISGKLDYAMLQMQVPYEYVNKTLYIVFRAINFTIQDDEALANCENIYLEIEFKEKERKCQYNSEISSSSNIIKVDSGSPYHSYSEKHFYSVYSNMNTFFHYQDFYLGDSSQDREGDYELKISVHQKFIERNLIDFVVEVLEVDTDYDEVQQSRHKKPWCEKMCITGGQKSYNEFHNVIQTSAKTYIRVWLTQSEPGSCANFQLFMSANKINLQSPLVSTLYDIKCQELDLPTTLNIDRYLGDVSKKQQKSFHYLERFRVDNLKNNSAHKITFELKEPTLVRFVAPIHKHIEFDIELRQVYGDEYGTMKSKKLIDSGAKGFEDSIVAQLDKGKYQIKLIFVSEEFFLSQPCQSISIEMAFATLSSLKQQIEDRNTNNRDTPIELSDLLNYYNTTHSIYRKAAIRTYYMQDPDILKKYQSYKEIYMKRFIIPKFHRIGLMIDIKSDFLTNDVNFALTNINNNKIFQHFRTENSNKVVLDSLPGGEYEFLIYAHNILSNFENSMIREFDVSFTIDIHFIKWTVVDNFQKHQIMMEIASENKKIMVESIDLNQQQCVQEYAYLPTQIKSFNGEEININNDFMIPVVEQYEYTVDYSPDRGQDALRIIIERPNTKMWIYAKNEKEPLYDSFSTNNGQQRVLIANSLKYGNTYTIQFEFNQNENYQEFEEDFCQYFRMEIISSKMSEECNQKIDNSNTTPDQISLDGDEQKMVYMKLDSTLNKQRLHINEDDTDLEISIDYTDIFYIPVIKLGKSNMNSKQTTASDNIGTEIKPVEIDSSIKNRVTYKFYDLKKGEYKLFAIQYTKPKNCINQIYLDIRTSRLQDSSIEKTHFGAIKTFSSLEEIQNINRYVEKLPVSLNTYKYLAEEPYLLVSEYLAIDPENTQNNKLSFNVEKDKSMIRIYVESDEIYMSIRDVSKDKVLSSYHIQTLIEKLPAGKYEIFFEFSTEIAKQKAAIFKNSFRVTISLFDQQFALDKYVKVQGKSLANCEANKNFPLALNKNTNLKDKSREITYDYPFLRISGQTLLSNYLVDQYAFRVNDTTRFIFSVGMHMVTSHVTLRLNELKDYGNSYIGKQEFNLNVLDIILGPGDYSLQIEQPSLFNWDYTGIDIISELEGQKKDNDSTVINVCGIYSLSGKETPLKELGQQKGRTSQQRCEIKEVLPNKIYKSEADTKQGMEYFINHEGTFSRAFEEILIKKSRRTTVIPNTDRIEIQVPEDGLLSLILQYKQKQNQMFVKLFDAAGFTEVNYKPLFNYAAESANNMLEETYLFKMQKGKSYFIIIYYNGEIEMDSTGMNELCEYYNVYLSFDTNTRMRDELSCIDEKMKTKSNIKVANFANDIPAMINTRSFDGGSDYKFDGYTELKYPNDYEKLTEQDSKDLIIKSVEIDIPNGFNIDTLIRYDFPYSLFEFNLFEQIRAEDNNPILEPAATQLPIEVELGDNFSPTLVREMKSKDLKSPFKYIFAISDQISWHIMDMLYQEKKQPLCIYSEIEIKLSKKQEAQALQASTPLITAAFPHMTKDSQKAFVVSKDKNEIQMSLQFSTSPFQRNSLSQQKQATYAQKVELSNLVSLQFLNPFTNELIYQKKPIRIQTDQQQKFYTFVFSIQDEQNIAEPDYILKLNVDFANLVDKQGRQFGIKNDVELPKFRLQMKANPAILKKEAEKAPQTEAEKVKKNFQTKEEVQEQKEVKCLCLHGECKKGESECWKCHQGWTGAKCDVQVKADNVNKKQDEKKQGKTKKSTGANEKSKMKNDRYESEFQDMDSKQSKSSSSSSKSSSQMKGETLDDIKRSSQDYYTQNKQTTSQLDTSNLLVQQTESEGYFASAGKIIKDLLYIAVILIVIVLVAYILLRTSKIKEYLPVPLSERDDDNSSDSGVRISQLQSMIQMELSDLRQSPERRQQERHQQQQQRQQMEPQNIGSTERLNEEMDEETIRLTNELNLYSYDVSEQQDSADMINDTYQQQQQRQQQQHNIQPQSNSEPEQTSHEIEDALKEMNEFDYDEDDEYRRFV